MKKQFTAVTLAAVMTAGLLPVISASAAEPQCVVNAVITDSGYTVNVNNSGSEKEAVLYTAVYDAGGSFVSVKSKAVTVAEGSNTFTAEPVDADDDDRVQIYLWDANLHPLADITVPVEDTGLAALTVAGSEKKESSYADYYRVSFNEDDDTVKAYLGAITSVTVGGREYSFYSGTDYFSSSSTYQYKIGTEGYWYSSGGVKNRYLDLTADGIPDYEVKTDIVIKAEGYKDLTFSIDNSDKHLAAAPAVSGTVLEYSNPDYYRVSFADDDSAVNDYTNAITSVTVGGRTYSYSSYWYGSTAYSYKRSYEGYSYVYKYLDLTADGIAESGKTEVTVSATGYVDLTFTIDNSNVTLSTPPAFDKAERVEQSSYYSSGTWSYYSISFSGTDISTYLNRISSVTVGGTAYSKSSYSFYSSDTSMYRVSSPNLQLTGDAISDSGKTTVVISAKGYEDLTFAIDNSSSGGGDEPGDEPGADKAALTVSGASKTTPSFGDVYYRVTFAENESDITAYINSITAVKVGDNTYSKASSSFWNDTNKWKTATDSAYGTTVGIDLTADGFNTSGDTVITITADGYKELKFTVKADGTIGGNTSGDGIDVTGIKPGNVVKDTTSNGAYQFEYSTSDSTAMAWLQKISSVKVNGTVYSAGSYPAYYSNLYYKGSYSLTLSKTSAFKTGENTVVIESDGYKTMTMTVNVDNNDYATVTSVQ